MKNVILVFIWLLTGLSAFLGRHAFRFLRFRKHRAHEPQGADARSTPKKEVPTNRVSFAVNRQADQLSKQGEVEQGFVPYEDAPREAPRARTFSRGSNRVIQ